ncbi:hypothetical protein [Reinekea blandensis]|uniref:Uncharacterized protein n=1 Tax=Reinekea blandensis MED297 TaxID=314283 RepID=A4BJ87_9GAMM|nr:hypothetical protein [Reinekea blandensis]EAR07840.1 hypothetical protein MED297_05329 [Reinekea sp. MED297] [Reinekea blandensis MED297]
MAFTVPRLLKEPTGWVVIVMVLGFLYVQWPTRVRTTPEPEYIVQQPVNGFTVQWEAEPEVQSDSNPQAWGLTRKRMSFLVQSDTLDGTFEALVREAAEQDRSTVNGAVQEPLVIGERAARYAFFDAESRVQQHRWYLLDDNRWVKVSVLYKPSMESRVERAGVFLANAIPG